MNTKPKAFRKYLPLLAIMVLVISAMACNLYKLVVQEPYDEPRPGEEEPYFHEDERHHDEHRFEGEEPFHGNEEDRHHDEEPWHHEEEPFEHHEEPFHHEDEPFHGDEEHRHHDEEPRHHEEEPFHGDEEDRHHDEAPFHGEEPHHEEGHLPEGCLPESGCPGEQPDDAHAGGEWTTDLAVTDIYPGNQPHGQFHVRVTNHGPGTLNNVQIRLYCGYDSQDKKTGLVGPSKMVDFEVTLGMQPGESQEFPTGLNLDSNTYGYIVGCNASVGFNDPDQFNNDYSEVLH